MGVEWSGEAQSGREVFLKGWEGSDGPPRGPGGVGRPVEVGRLFRRVGRGWEALPEGWKGSGGSPGWPEWVGRLSRMAGGEVERPSRMAGRDWKALPGPEMGWKALLNGQEGLGDPPRGPGGVGRPSQVTYRGQEVLLEDQQRSGGLSGGSGVGGNPSWMEGDYS